MPVKTAQEVQVQLNTYFAGKEGFFAPYIVEEFLEHLDSEDPLIRGDVRMAVLTVIYQQEMALARLEAAANTHQKALDALQWMASLATKIEKKDLTSEQFNQYFQGDDASLYLDYLSIILDTLKKESKTRFANQEPLIITIEILMAFCRKIVAKEITVDLTKTFSDHMINDNLPISKEEVAILSGNHNLMESGPKETDHQIHFVLILLGSFCKENPPKSLPKPTAHEQLGRLLKNLKEVIILKKRLSSTDGKPLPPEYYLFALYNMAYTPATLTTESLSTYSVARIKNTRVVVNLPKPTDSISPQEQCERQFIANFIALTAARAVARHKPIELKKNILHNLSLILLASDRHLTPYELAYVRIAPPITPDNNSSRVLIHAMTSGDLHVSLAATNTATTGKITEPKEFTKLPPGKTLESFIDDKDSTAPLRAPLETNPNNQIIISRQFVTVPTSLAITRPDDLQKNTEEVYSTAIQTDHSFKALALLVLPYLEYYLKQPHGTPQQNFQGWLITHRYTSISNAVESLARYYPTIFDTVLSANEVSHNSQLYKIANENTFHDEVRPCRYITIEPKSVCDSLKRAVEAQLDQAFQAQHLFTHLGDPQAIHQAIHQAQNGTAFFASNKSRAPSTYPSILAKQYATLKDDNTKNLDEKLGHFEFAIIKAYQASPSSELLNLLEYIHKKQGNVGIPELHFTWMARVAEQAKNHNQSNIESMNQTKIQFYLQLAIAKDDPVAHALAMVHASQNDTDLEEAKALPDPHRSFIENMGESLATQKSFANAIEHYYRGKYTDALNAFKIVAEALPNCIYARYRYHEAQLHVFNEEEGELPEYNTVIRHIDAMETMGRYGVHEAYRALMQLLEGRHHNESHIQKVFRQHLQNQGYSDTRARIELLLLSRRFANLFPYKNIQSFDGTIKDTDKTLITLFEKQLEEESTSLNTTLSNHHSMAGIIAETLIERIHGHHAYGVGLHFAVRAIEQSKTNDLIGWFLMFYLADFFMSELPENHSSQKDFFKARQNCEQMLQASDETSSMTQYAKARLVQYREACEQSSPQQGSAAKAAALLENIPSPYAKFHLASHLLHCEPLTEANIAKIIASLTDANGYKVFPIITDNLLKKARSSTPVVPELEKLSDNAGEYESPSLT